MSNKTFLHALLLVGSLWLVLVLWLAASVAWCGEQQPLPAPAPQGSPRANTNAAPVNCHQSEPPTSSPYLVVARADAQREGIDVLTFTWQINQESGYQPGVTSPAGAEGISQFMPDTARGLGIDPWNPPRALAGAAKLDAAHLAQYASAAQALAEHYGGSAARYDYGLALSAYNAGPGATTGAWNRAYGAGTRWSTSGPWAWLALLGQETQPYVLAILGCAL